MTSLKLLSTPARTQIVPSDALEGDSVGQDNVVNKFTGGGAKGHRGLAFNVRDGKVTKADYIHADQDSKLGVRCGPIGHDDASDLNLIGKSEINDVRILQATSIPMVDVPLANRSQAKRLNQGCGDDAFGSSCVPQGPSRNRIREGSGWIRWSVSRPNGDFCDDFIGSAMCLSCEGLEVKWRGHSLPVHRTNRHCVGARAGLARLDHERAEWESLLSSKIGFERRCINAFDLFTANH